MIKLCLILFLTFLAVDTIPNPDAFIFVAINGTAIIKLPQVANYRRVYGYGSEDIFRVCNGKNKKTCGYWESVESRTKMRSGATSYDKKKKALVIKKVTWSDYADYMPGNRKQSKRVLNIV